MFKLCIRDLLSIKIKDPVTGRKLYWLEKILFSPFVLFSFSFGGVQLLYGISRGSGGCLYRGIYDGRDVVVKIPSRQSIISNNRETEDLRQEFECGRKLSGIECIPEYIDLLKLSVNTVAETIDVSLLVLEYKEGVTLSRLLGKRDILNMHEKYQLFKRLLDGLAAVHRAGVVHKDINPANILVKFSLTKKRLEDVWLVDFGASHHERRFVAEYGSPEQQMPIVFGDVGELSDMFSLGLVMYELLEGDLPFPRDLAMREIAGQGELNLQFSTCEDSAMKQILTRMLVKEPGKRFSSIAVLRRKVEQMM